MSSLDSTQLVWQLAFWDELTECMYCVSYETWEEIAEEIVKRRLKHGQFVVVLGDRVNVQVSECVEVSLSDSVSVVVTK